MSSPNKTKLLIISLSILTSLVFLVSPALADDYGLGATAGEAGLQKIELTQAIGSLIKAVLAFIGVILLILMIYGGFLWMTAQGEDDKVKKAKKILLDAIVGVFIVIFAYTLTWFIIDQVSKLGSSGGGK